MLDEVQRGGRSAAVVAGRRQLLAWRRQAAAIPVDRRLPVDARFLDATSSVVGAEGYADSLAWVGALIGGIVLGIVLAIIVRFVYCHYLKPYWTRRRRARLMTTDPTQ